MREIAAVKMDVFGHDRVGQEVEPLAKDLAAPHGLHEAERGLVEVSAADTRLEQSALDFDGHKIPLRVSIGYEAYGPEDGIDDLICRADMAMYYFKRRKQAPIARVAAE